MGVYQEPYAYSFSELKRRMKAEKKAAEKEAKVKEQSDQKKTNDKSEQNNYGADEETLDPNVRAENITLLC